MKIKIVSVGKIKEKNWQKAEAEYSKRITRYSQLEHVFVKDAPIESIKNYEKVKELEASLISAKINAGEFVVALDRQGKQMSSERFAKFLNDKMLEGNNKITFVIGGPLGLSEHLQQESDLTLSISLMTLPHELSKVILLEQIYRAFSILKGEKYHK